MNLFQKFQQHWKQNFSHLSINNCNLLIAASGGVDSIVLTDLVFKAGFHFMIAHCNFQLRGKESERDENFVKSLAEKYNQEVLVHRFDTKQYAASKKTSLQEAARELRYDWFAGLLTSNFKPQTSNFIVTAHHADDNIETMLMFFFRGTGISGLTGIPAYDKKRNIIRPLIFATREDILLYAKENNLAWVEDSSNAQNKYTRNFFRNEFIPAISKYFPNVKENLLLNLHRFEEAEQLYQQAIRLHKKNLLEYKGDEIHIPVLKLQKAEPLDSVIWEIIKEYNFHSHQLEEVKKLLNAANSSYMQSISHRIIKNRKWLIIAPHANETSQHILIEENDKQVQFANGFLYFEITETSNLKLQSSNTVAELDAKHIAFPLLVRKWKQGDYFFPLGMQNPQAGRPGKKKLSRFFIDQKLSKTEKENTWVIETNKKILWIVGQRIDERFKVTNTTKEVLKIIFEST